MARHDHRPADGGAPIFSAAVDPHNDRLYFGAEGGAYIVENAGTSTLSSTATATEVQVAGAGIFTVAF